MKTVEVNASKRYTVHIGENLLKDAGRYLQAVKRPCKAAIVTDDIVNGLYADTLEQSLRAAGYETVKFVFPHGEMSKSMETLSALLEFAATQHLTRSDCFVALGGGIVGDLTGFCASCFLRGVSFVQIPTTLLAAVDASVGGKTAVNLRAGKNLAGAFYQPNLVLCDTLTLNTLPPEIFADGCAEVVKYGMLAGEEFFHFLQNTDIRENMETVIARCVEIKRDIVMQDERDLGLRQLLNFGHTVGHAIEACSHFEISHGSAVAIGMVIAARGAYLTGKTETDCTEDIQALLFKNHLPTACAFSAKALCAAALSDKKRAGGTISLVVPQKIGTCVLCKTPVEELREFIEKGL